MTADGTDRPSGSIFKSNPTVRKVRTYLRPARRVAREAAARVEERRDPRLAWLRTAYRRHPSPPDVWERMWDNRRRLVRLLAPGRSFIDVGGMYGVSGELAFLAEECGATRSVLFDAMDPSPEFEETHKRIGSKVQHVQGDLHDAEAIASLGTFDVVWCSGVLYHSPHPMLQLLLLRQMASQTFVTGNLMIPEIPGFEQMCLLYPGMSKTMMDSFAKMYGGAERFPGMAEEFDPAPAYAYANMWWGFTPTAMRSMLHYSGFSIKEEYLYLPFCLDVVAEVGGESLDIYPPPNFHRDRAWARYGHLPPDEIPGWALLQMEQLRLTPVSPPGGQSN